MDGSWSCRVIAGTLVLIGVSYGSPRGVARAEENCSVSFNVVNTVDLGSAEFDVTFDPAIQLINCFEIGTLAVNNQQINSGSFSADVLCSFVSDPPCTEAISGTAPLLACCVVAPVEPSVGDFTPTLSNPRNLTGQPAAGDAAVAAVVCGVPGQCCCPATTTTTVRATTTTSTTSTTLGGDDPVCADLNGDRAVLATDCLIMLRVATAIEPCGVAACACAPKGTLPTTATDALLCLKFATNQPVSLNCPCSSPNFCEDSEAPTCGGDCPPGETCGPDPFEPDQCECLSACEASAAPACGASCEDDAPGAVCQPVGFSTAGGPVEQLCLCLAPDTQLCTDADAPACQGVCQPGAACEPDGGSGCTCSLLPQQGPCAQASTPLCGGTCPDGFICQDLAASGCDCVPFQAQQETCFDEAAPICGGVCSFGEACASDLFDECECFDPCGLSQAPTCNGVCADDGDLCLVRTATFAGGSLDFCDCVPGR